MHVKKWDYTIYSILQSICTIASAPTVTGSVYKQKFQLFVAQGSSIFSNFGFEYRHKIETCVTKQFCPLHQWPRRVSFTKENIKLENLVTHSLSVDDDVLRHYSKTWHSKSLSITFGLPSVLHLETNALTYSLSMCTHTRTCDTYRVVPHTSHLNYMFSLKWIYLHWNSLKRMHSLYRDKT